jgi:hypothetical protein
MPLRRAPAYVSRDACVCVASLVDHPGAVVFTVARPRAIDAPTRIEMTAFA